MFKKVQVTLRVIVYISKLTLSVKQIQVVTIIQFNWLMIFKSESKTTLLRLTSGPTKQGLNSKPVIISSVHNSRSSLSLKRHHQ